MSFSDGMKSMCETLAQSRSDRERAMAELHSVNRKDRMERRSTIKRVAGDVKRLFGDVHVMVQHFHDGRGKMSKEMRGIREEFLANTRKETQGTLRECRLFLKGFRGEHKKMAEELHQMLGGCAQRIHRNTSRFLKEFSSQFGVTCKKEGEEREAFYHGIQKQVSGIRREVGQMRKGFQEVHKSLHADFMKAKGAWMEFAGGMHKPKAMPKPKASGLQGRILSFLKGSPEGMTIKELSYALGMPEKPLKRALMSLRRKKKISKRKNIFRTA